MQLPSTGKMKTLYKLEGDVDIEPNITMKYYDDPFIRGQAGGFFRSCIQ